MKIQNAIFYITCKKILNTFILYSKFIMKFYMKLEKMMTGILNKHSIIIM